MSIYLLIFALVQGVTEFIPVSSDGHLTLAQRFLGLSPSVSLDVYFHLATLLAILIFFRHRLFALIRQYFWPLVSATLVTGILGLALQSWFESMFLAQGWLWLFFLISAIFLLVSRRSVASSRPITPVIGALVGLVQTAALLPGVSRSALTISTMLLLGVKPKTAFDFSFLILIPTVLGATLLKADDISLVFTQYSLAPLIISGALCFLVGYLSLVLLHRFVVNRRFHLFGYYLLALSLLSLLLRI